MNLNSHSLSFSQQKSNMSGNPYSSFLLHLFLCLSVLMVRAKSDPDPIQDYCIADNRSPQPFFINGKPCIDPNQASSSHFVTSALSKPGNTKTNRYGYNATLTNTVNLPGLNTLGLTLARIDIAGNGLYPPHSHPRASEVTTCLKGILLVGFVDTSNRLFTQQLKPGESFVFPRGLIHFIYNIDSLGPAMTLSGLSSQNPGTQIASLATFTSNPPIPDFIMKKAFQISDSDLAKIRKNLAD
ncbi:germin-like protein subfamily 1 member 1 [Morus notabilis]|nr:germin-like protein subfamily 1 member 1 [Morus notabilis]